MSDARAAPSDSTVTAPSAPAPPARGWRLLWRALAVIAALIALAVLLQPWWLAWLVSRQLTASARRPVRIESMWVTFSASFQPVVEARGIRIDNAPWADAQRPFAALAAATATVSWRSVSERRPVIGLVVLRQGSVDLERRADGLRNWRLGHPEDRGPGRYKVLAIAGDNAVVRFRHEPLALDLEARTRPSEASAAGSAGDEPMPTRLTIGGTWRGAPFTIEATTSRILTLLETGRLARVRGRVEAGAARLDVDGRLGDFVHDPRVDAQLALTAPSLAAFDALLGPRRHESKPIAVDAVVRGEPGRYTLAIATGHLGRTDFSGELGWTRGADRNLARVHLRSDSARLDDLRSLMPQRPSAERAALASARAPAPAAAASSEPESAGERDGTADARRAKSLDIELSLAVHQLQAEHMPWLRGANVDASLASGRLAVSRFDVGLGPGRAVGRATVDLAARPPRGEAELDLSAIRIEDFLGAQPEKHRLTGTLHGRAVLRASGDSAEALLASASGTLSAFVSAGTISSLLDAEMGLQGGRVVRSALFGSEPLPIRCAAAVLDLEHGVGRIRTLVLDTERTRTTGRGTIDLSRESFDVVLTPEAKQPGLFILDRSIRLHGALHHVQRELVARASLPRDATRSCRAERP